MKAYPYFFKSYMEDGEIIYYAVHHHIFTVFKPLAIVTLFFIAPPILLWIAQPKLALIWMIWIALGVIKFILEIIAWYFNALLVTNLNLVDVEWNGVFDRSALRIEYNQIESFSYNISGFINTVFNIGDLSIAKISGNQITVKGIFKPKKRTQILTKIQDKLVSMQLQKDHTNLKNILTNMLQTHIQDNKLNIKDDL